MIKVEPPIVLKNIPTLPGVYLMKNDKEKVIYVGKAKNLKNRVSSYFLNQKSHTLKTEELVKNISDIDFFLCNTEVEALILENNLIKKYKPKYNILLKDQKTYPYIKFTLEKFPKIEIVRTTKKLEDKADYYGPYPVSIFFAVKQLLKIFSIRTCSKNMDKVYDRPCLKYYMNLCPGPCKFKNIEKEYSENVNNFKKFLKGDQQKIVNELKLNMKNNSKEMNFELALKDRNKITLFEKMLQNQVIEHSREIDEDVFVFEETSSHVFLCILNIREGKILNKNSIIISLEKSQEDNIFERIVTMYYEKRAVPKNLIFDFKYEENGEILIQWAEMIKNKKIHLHFPKIDSRRYKLLEMGYINLREEVEKYFRQKKNIEDGLNKIKSKLKLKKLPRTIECFDISNIQGKDPVAAMTVSINGEAEPKKYRHFKITVKDTPDDFMMMREALTRRYSKLEINELPDLILVDGGKGQLSVATEVLESLNKSSYLDIISIAKREEEVFKSREKEPYIFSKKDEALKILQRLRDESHRFGITHHRKLRSKRNIKSFLDDIEGIGPKRKKSLIQKFGTIKNIKEATIEQLAEIVPEKVAIGIKENS